MKNKKLNLYKVNHVNNIKGLLCLGAVLLLNLKVFAQVMPTPEKTFERTLPEEPGFQSDTTYKKLYKESNSKLNDLMQEIDESRLKLATPPQSGFVPIVEDKNSTAIKKDVPSVRPKTSAAKSYFKKSYGFSPSSPSLGSTVKTFAVSEKSTLEDDDTHTVLPAGSFVKAKVVSGVEANTLEPYPVLLQLEYAFKGPNGSKIDLSNCFMIAKARANLSTERVIMETETLSCVVESGEHFKTQARGYTAGEDSSFGSTGTFISKQGQVLLAAVLANVAKNAGEAVSLAQQSTQVVGADKAATATNVTGSKAAFVAGKSVVDGAGLIAQWYLDYAKQLIPSIGIGSGQDVHVVMLESIKVPDLKE